MKVAELMEALSELPPDMEVIVQKDSDGNGYSPLSDVDANAIYIARTTWWGDVYSTNWTASDACFNEDEWKEFKAENPRCCVLAPVN